MSRIQSPSAPLFSLKMAYDQIKGIYEQFGQASLTEDDLATALGHKTTNSGPFRQKKSTLLQYSLLEEKDEKYSISKVFFDLRDNDPESQHFRKAAFSRLKSVKVFTQLLEGLHDRLPEDNAIAARLERSGFSRSRANEVAAIFRESLAYAGGLDKTNRLIFPTGGDEGNHIVNGDKEGRTYSNSDSDNLLEVSNAYLTIEVPTIAGSKVIIRYPHEFTQADAGRVTAVLNAIATP